MARFELENKTKYFLKPLYAECVHALRPGGFDVNPHCSVWEGWTEMTSYGGRIQRTWGGGRVGEGGI